MLAINSGTYCAVETVMLQKKFATNTFRQTLVILTPRLFKRLVGYSELSYFFSYLNDASRDNEPSLFLTWLSKRLINEILPLMTHEIFSSKLAPFIVAPNRKYSCSFKK